MLIFTILLSIPAIGRGQCDFFDDYSDPTLWNQVGENVIVTNDQVEFVDGALDGDQRRLFRSLGFIVDPSDCWEVSFKFLPTMVGTLDGLPMTGHIPFALSETNQDPRYACPDIPCTGNPMNDQDAICVGYYTTNPPNGQVYFIIQCSNTGTSIQSEKLVFARLNQAIFVKLTKQGPRLTLDLFNDQAHTQRLGNGPVAVDFVDLEPLSFVQHACNAGGWNERELTASVDDVCLSLVTDSVASHQISVSICEGEIYFFGGREYDANGTFFDTTSLLCYDSVTRLELTILEPPVIDVFHLGCIGDGYTLEINNTIYNEANPQGQEILVSTANCDSIVNINLEFNDEIIRDEAYLGCTGEGYAINVNGTIYDESNPSGQEVMLSASNCDSIVNIELEFYETFVSDENYVGCSGDGYFISINGTTYNESNPTGQEIISTINGCDSIINIDFQFVKEEIIRSTINISSDVDRLINIRDYASIDSNTHIAWSPQELVECDSCAATKFIGTKNDTLIVTLTDINGCNQELLFYVNVMVPTAIYIPSVFSPNADGINDTFQPLVSITTAATIRHFRIYNRWGGKVFSISEKRIHDPSIAWDGTTNGKPNETGVYVYVVDVEFEDGSHHVESGTITLVR